MNTQNKYKILKIDFILFIMLVLICSCSTEVEIVDNSKDFYIVNAVMNADSSIQYITVAKNYFVEGSDPYENTADPFIKNAVVEVLDDFGPAHIFTPESMPRPEDARYQSELNYYKCEDFEILPNKTYKLNVKINNGPKLFSEIKVPDFNRILFNDDKTFPINFRNELKTSWKFYRNEGQQAFYIPALYLNYFVRSEGKFEKKRVEIPKMYLGKNPDSKAVFPTISNYKFADFKYEAIDSTISWLYPPGPERENIYLSSLELEVTVLDIPLGTYYILSKNADTGFTVLLDYNDYTNITNGLGIFGTRKKVSNLIDLNTNYVFKLGYNYTAPKEKE